MAARDFRTLGGTRASALAGPCHRWITDSIASLLGAIFAGYYFDREVFPQLNFRKWWRQAVTTWGVRFGIWAPLIAACLLMPEKIGVPTLLVAGGYLVIHFAIQWGLILKFLRWVKYLTPAESRLQGIVDATAARLGVNVRATLQMEGPQANAFAFNTTRDLVFSKHLLEICNDEEVAAICAHELAHLSESKAALAGRLLSSLYLFPIIFMFPAASYFGTAGVLLPIFAILLIGRFAAKFLQKMERSADTLASAEQHAEGVHARALEKLYRENQVPAVSASNSQTHPHLYDRILAAGISPDFPRPTKPRRLTPYGWFYAVSAGALLVLAVASG